MDAMTASTGTALTTDERAELAACEAVIARHRNAVLETAEQLRIIRDKRLYRETHPNFDAYCLERWGYGKNYANKQIAAADVMANVGTMVPNGPASERQVRPLTQLPPEEQADAWQEAVDTAPAGKVTAKHVAAVVAKRKAPDGERDGFGRPVKPYQPSVKVEPEPAPTPVNAADFACRADRLVTSIRASETCNNPAAVTRESVLYEATRRGLEAMEAEQGLSWRSA
jgi:hypothetical protein